MDTQRNKNKNIIRVSKEIRNLEKDFKDILDIFIGKEYMKAKIEIDRLNAEVNNSFKLCSLKADIYNILNLYNDAIKLYRRALSLEIKKELLHNLAIAYYNMENYSEALIFFEYSSSLGLEDSIYFYLRTLAVQSEFDLKEKLRKRGYNLNSEDNILADIWFHLRDYERVTYYFKRYEEKLDICLWDISHLIKYIYSIYRVENRQVLESKFNHIKNCKIKALDREHDLTRYNSSYLDIKKLNYLYENIHLFKEIDLNEKINFLEYGYFNYYEDK